MSHILGVVLVFYAFAHSGTNTCSCGFRTVCFSYYIYTLVSHLDWLNLELPSKWLHFRLSSHFVMCLIVELNLKTKQNEPAKSPETYVIRNGTRM